MEKKFKLIKRYPGDCLEIGFEGSVNFFLQRDNINPEFWPEFFEEIKEPLFITEDTVEIYDRSATIYLVNPISFVFRSIRAFEWDKTRLIFSSKEAAEKWIDENKPVFSKKQILDAIDKICFKFNGRLPSDTLDVYGFKKELSL